MKERKGEKVGWIVGWLGGFVWLFLLSIVWLVQGKITSGVLGLGLFVLAVVFIIVLSPWKHSKTRYWKLMLPVYALLIVSAGTYVWLEGSFGNLGLSWWSILYLTPVLVPFATIGTRCWDDGNA